MGYTKVTLPASQTIIGMQFEAVGTPGMDLTVQDIQSENVATGTRLQFWTGEGFENITYFGEDTDGIYENDDYEESLGAGWGDADQIVSDVSVPRGTAFWVRSTSVASVIFAGQVGTTGSINVPAGQSMVINPFPTTIALKDIVATGLASGSRVQVWTGTGYENIVYFGEDTDGVYETDDYDESLGAGWGDADQIVSSVELDAGIGFWIRTTTAATLTFPNPL